MREFLSRLRRKLVAEHGAMNDPALSPAGIARTIAEMDRTIGGGPKLAAKHYADLPAPHVVYERLTAAGLSRSDRQ